MCRAWPWGIHAEAHRGALPGPTAAVLGSGEHVRSPPRDWALYEMILQHDEVASAFRAPSQGRSASLPPAQPHHRGARNGCGDRRGFAKERCADHCRNRLGSGTGGPRRAGADRPAQQRGNQPSDRRRRGSRPGGWLCGRHTVRGPAPRRARAARTAHGNSRPHPSPSTRRHNWPGGTRKMGAAPHAPREQGHPTPTCDGRVMKTPGRGTMTVREGAA